MGAEDWGSGGDWGAGVEAIKTSFVFAVRKSRGKSPVTLPADASSPHYYIFLSKAILSLVYPLPKITVEDC